MTTNPKDRYSENDNDGNPKSAYLTRISAMGEAELLKECESSIWLSAYASNNRRSDYHWHADACYDECSNRGRLDIYTTAHSRACNQ